MRLLRRRNVRPTDAPPAWVSAPVAEALGQARDRFSDIQRNGNIAGYDQPDWNRLAMAAELVAGDRILEIGPGPGVLLTTIHLLDPAADITALDIRRHSMLRLPDEVRFEQASITDPSVHQRLGDFDCVVCMEVLEHLEVDDLAPALDNLRRLTSGRLIATVPYEEPEPVWWHDRPGGHRQSFSRQRLEALFPTAATTRLPRYGVDWIVLVEDAGVDHGFAELRPAKFVDLLRA